MALGPTRFLFGDTVSLADLGFYGQLKVMSYDPTPMAWLRAETPYLYRWLDHADDAGGIEGGWADGLSEPVKDLLAICGDTYLPFLQANVEALAAGAETFSLTVEGGRYEQGVFKYQAKCLEALKGEWAALDSDAKAALSAAIGKGASLLD
jgi:hypothetical protein